MGRVGVEMVNRLIWGLFLVAIGVTLLAVNLGWELPHGAWNYWPFLLIAMGTAKMLFGGSDEGGGFWLILSGLYGWISIWNVGGLTWRTAWPIFVIAGGLSLILNPVVRRGVRSRRGNGSGANDVAGEGVERAG